MTSLTYSLCFHVTTVGSRASKCNCSRELVPCLLLSLLFDLHHFPSVTRFDTSLRWEELVVLTVPSQINRLTIKVCRKELRGVIYATSRASDYVRPRADCKCSQDNETCCADYPSASWPRPMTLVYFESHAFRVTTRLFLSFHSSHPISYQNQKRTIDKWLTQTILSWRRRLSWRV